ncbi:hypothetical protein EFA69_06550 [Rufibacter immobilis]|uniref:Uncharacterized protein n=1 Tax=Rufibacter immobilis TaxID=1348778 RepID=A0A3M9N0M1_9BACT|nr:hypothetical protein [Rufibacter immobilis]RNI30947.1 hypothetical protein EFA69_06550 [Rufibacter immobilis]
MVISIPLIALIFTILGGIGSLVGIYVVLKTNDTRQESEITYLKERVTKLEHNVSNELKEIKDLLLEVKIELAVQKERHQ